MSVQTDSVSAIVWHGDRLELLDQRLLPERTEYLSLDSAPAIAEAIRTMVVRGAPAIGVAAAYAVALSIRQHVDSTDRQERIDADLALLRSARPTAVNLGWALDRMEAKIAAAGLDPEQLRLEAQAIHVEDEAGNRRMGEHGAALIDSPCSVLTHCNAGALATAGYGTALGVIRAAHAKGLIDHVYAGETRPWWQGARLTAWELVQEGIPVSLIADSAASWAMRQDGIRWVIVGADRVAANGDVANKIGTYSLAVSARYHGVKLMVAAPVSTIDLQAPSGNSIPIEQRDPDELLKLRGAALAAEGAQAWNPVFDVTPAELVDVLVTERGVIEKPDEAKIRAHVLGS